MFEIIIYQINILLFHPYRAMVVQKKGKYRLQNPYRSVVLLGHNLMEIICWFTAVSAYFSHTNTSIVKILMESTIRILTFNYEVVSDELDFMQYIIFTEVLCGIVLVIISLAKFIGELPHVEMEFEEDEDIDESSKCA